MRHFICARCSIQNPLCLGWAVCAHVSGAQLNLCRCHRKSYVWQHQHRHHYYDFGMWSVFVFVSRLTIGASASSKFHTSPLKFGCAVSITWLCGPFNASKYIIQFPFAQILTHTHAHDDNRRNDTVHCVDPSKKEKQWNHHFFLLSRRANVFEHMSFFLEQRKLNDFNGCHLNANLYKQHQQKVSEWDWAREREIEKYQPKPF